MKLNRALDRLAYLIISKLSRGQIKKHEKIYGRFNKADYRKFMLHGLPNVSKYSHGEIIKWARDVVPSPKRVLLAGEENNVKEPFKQAIQSRKIYTAGLSNADYEWNFEKNPLESIGKFDLIISQAILEHLLNPYKHMYDLVSLLVPKGFLIIHSQSPAFPYHRHPIDTCRFFPDWFETIARKLNLTIIKKRINNAHIFYLYQKTPSTVKNR